MLKNNTPVIVKNLGDGREYKGTVVGVVDKYYYIVRMNEQFPEYDYECKLFVPAVVFEVA